MQKGTGILFSNYRPQDYQIQIQINNSEFCYLAMSILNRIV